MRYLVLRKVKLAPLDQVRFSHETFPFKVQRNGNLSKPGRVKTIALLNYFLLSHLVLPTPPFPISLIQPVPTISHPSQQLTVVTSLLPRSIIMQRILSISTLIRLTDTRRSIKI